MKKRLVIIATVILSLLLSSCGSSKLNDNNTRAAKRIIKTVDSYLNGDIGAEAAFDIIDEEYDNIDDSDENDIERSSFSSYTLMISIELSYMFVDEDGDISKIKDYRNKIAELIGERKYIDEYNSAITEDDELNATENENDESYISYEELSKEFQFTKIYTEEPNSVGGVDFGVQFRYSGEKEIKYLTLTVTPYNAVHDVVSSEIGSKSTVQCKITGPITYSEKDSETGEITSAWYPIKFEDLWYNKTISYALVDKMVIEYTDGTIITCEDGIPIPDEATDAPEETY